MPSQKKLSVEHIQSIVSFRGVAVQAVGVTVGLALGVNLLATGLALQSRWSGIVILSIGLVLITCTGMVLAAMAVPPLKRRVRLVGALAVKGPDHEVLKIRGYRFAEETYRNLKALCVENKALGKAWCEGPLVDFEQKSPPKKTEAARSSVPPTYSIVKVEVKAVDTPATRLVREATEYFVLNHLSMHLSEYFDERFTAEDPEVVVMKRRDIPGVLLDNHFLESFSRPIEDREVFPHDQVPSSSVGEVYAIFAGGGAIYDRFELILPRGTSVERIDQSTIAITTKRFTLRIEVEFPGVSFCLPRDFPDLYMGVDDRDAHAYTVRLNIDVQFKVGSFLTKSGWEYFQWLDSFLAKLEGVFSFDHFIERIDWNAAHSVAIVDRNVRRMQAEAIKAKNKTVATVGDTAPPAPSGTC